jgi:hypothetical protein
MTLRTSVQMALALAAVTGQLAIPAMARGLETTVTTSQTAYGVGQTVLIQLTICNPEDSTLGITFFSSCDPPLLEVLDSTSEVIAYAKCNDADGALVHTTWPAHACSNRTFVWPQTGGTFNFAGASTGPQVPAGTYRIRSNPLVSPSALSGPFSISDAVPAVPTVDRRGAVALIGLLVALGLSLLRRR